MSLANAPTHRQRIADMSDTWRVVAVDPASNAVILDEEIVAIGIREALEIADSRLRHTLGYKGRIWFNKAELLKRAP